MSRVSRIIAVAGFCGLAGVLPPATATGGPSEFDLSFAPATAGMTTSLSLHILYRSATDPNGKPPALMRIHIETPIGTTFNTAAVPQCHASDLQLQVLGQAACPAPSRIGYGTLLAITGLGPLLDPVRLDMVVFNGGDELIEVFSLHNLGLVINVTRLSISDNVLSHSFAAPTPGGPPDFRTTVREIWLVLPAGNGLVVAPPACPSTHQWPYAVTLDFFDAPSQVAGGAVSC